MSTKTLDKADLFFERHGHISTLIARLIPGIRQVISLPAGLARMRLDLFCLFTSLGAGIWVLILALMGYWFGHNQELVAERLHQVLLVLAPVCILGILIYIRQCRKKTE